MPSKNFKNKIIVITGPTASGKTGLAVKLAFNFNGEIISADSRQVYKYMDIGTGKDLKEYTLVSGGKKIKIPYHLISIAHPNTDFNLAKWREKATRAIKKVLEKGRVPIVAGGTGLYIQALVDNFDLSGPRPDDKLRKKLEGLAVKELFGELKKLNEKFAENLHASDKKNKRRLIRYLEIMESKPEFSGQKNCGKYEYLIIGLTRPKQILKSNIKKRLIERLEKEGMAKEVEGLHKKYKVSWQRLQSFGLEYRFISRYLKGELAHDEMAEKLNIAIGQYAKRQMTWLRRWEKQGRKIHWINSAQEAERLAKNFLK